MERTGYLKHFLILCLATLFYTACEEEDTSYELEFSADTATQSEIQTAFIQIEDGETITFGAGVYDFTNTLSLDGKNEIIIKGAGKDETFLDFGDQISGGEGVLISNSTSIRIEGITIRDSQGDALKARDCDKISFVDVGTVWSGEPSQDNGAYGLYPVLCSEVYIENCYAYGASDAGIYVGQSDQVIVTNSVAEGNVAGIEIENTTNADVYNNEAYDNTGAILVFDLPGLTKYGNTVRVFNNNCHDNNRANFAPLGNIVASVPSGTGCMILSTKNVEIFDNKFDENYFAGVIVANYSLINENADDPDFEPFPSGIYIHDNEYKMSGTAEYIGQPTLIQQVMVILGNYNLDQPNILLDGLLQDDGDVCIQEESITFVNVNADDETYASVTTDRSNHNCEKTSLTAVVFEPY